MAFPPRSPVGRDRVCWNEEGAFLKNHVQTQCGTPRRRRSISARSAHRAPRQAPASILRGPGAPTTQHCYATRSRPPHMPPADSQSPAGSLLAELRGVLPTLPDIRTPSRGPSSPTSRCPTGRGQPHVTTSNRTSPLPWPSDRSMVSDSRRHRRVAASVVLHCANMSIWIALGVGASTETGAFDSAAR